MSWTNVPNANLEVGAPLRSIDILAIRDNIPALANGDSGAPKIKNAAYDAGSITVDKLSGNQTGAAPAFAARAFCVFNGAGPTISASGNIASVTRSSTGLYTVNFTTSMPDANFAVMATPLMPTTVGSPFPQVYVVGRTASSVTLQSGEYTGSSNNLTPRDYNISVVILR